MTANVVVSLNNEEKVLLSKAINFFDEIAEQFNNIDEDISCTAGDIVTNIIDIAERFKDNYDVELNPNERF